MSPPLWMRDPSHSSALLWGGTRHPGWHFGGLPTFRNGGGPQATGRAPSSMRPWGGTGTSGFASVSPTPRAGRCHPLRSHRHSVGRPRALGPFGSFSVIFFPPLYNFSSWENLGRGRQRVGGGLLHLPPDNRRRKAGCCPPSPPAPSSRGETRTGELLGIKKKYTISKTI